MKIYLRMAIIVCFTVIIASCGNGSQVTDSAVQKTNTGTPTSNAAITESSLEKLAKKEGKVVFYTSTAKSEIDPILDLFKKKYGIEIEYIQLRGNEMLERLKVESRTGNFKADVADAGPTTIYTLKKEDYFIPNKTVEADKILGTDPDGYFRGTVLNVYGILVNTNLVSEKDMPKSLKDLLDPKWKGKILSDDPRAVGGASSLFTYLIDHKDFGRPFLNDLAKQNVTFTRQYLENEKAVARGEYSIYIPTLVDSLQRLKDTPVKWVTPDDVVFMLPLSHGILKGATHPNAAKLFSEFITSVEAQKIRAKTRVPARVGIEADLLGIDLKGKNLVTLTPEQIDKSTAYFEEFAKIFK